MPHSAVRPGWPAAAASGVCALALAAARLWGSDVVAHCAALAALILALPWFVPAFVALSVLSAPFYVGLHVAGHPVALAPWLSTVILLAAATGCHMNAVLLLARLGRASRRRASDGGLAEFLRRTGAGAR